MKTTFQWEGERDWSWLVEPRELIIPPETPKIPISPIKQGIEWDNIEDESQLFIYLILKLLVKKDSEYGYYDVGGFTSMGVNYPTKEQFEQYGMKDLSVLEASDIPIEYEMELINQTEEGKFFSYTFDLNGQHKNMKSIDGIITE